MMSHISRMTQVSRNGGPFDPIRMTMRRIDGNGGGLDAWRRFESASTPTTENSGSVAPVGDSYSTGGIFANFDLGNFSREPGALRAELSKSFAGVDEEGLRKMEEEARARRAALQQCLRMTRGDPYLAARNTVRSEKMSGDAVSTLAVGQMESLQDPTDD